MGVAASTRTPVGEATSPIMSAWDGARRVQHRDDPSHRDPRGPPDGGAVLRRRRQRRPAGRGARPPAPFARGPVHRLDRDARRSPWSGCSCACGSSARPHAFEFDETYYAKDAWSLWHFGYARDYIDNDGGIANKHILAGQTTGLWKPDASMVVHPEVGKWLIGLGEKTFGFTPLGWRVVPAIVGTLLILVMIRFVRRLTGSTLLGCVAGVLVCFDGLEFVLSRLALLDIFVAFFVLCAVHCLVLDRDWYRAKMASLVPGQIQRPRDWGPVKALLFRPVAARLGHLLGPGLRQQVGGRLPPRGVRAPGGRLVRGRPSFVRRQLVRRPKALVADAPCRRSSTSCSSASSSTSPPGPAG